MNLIIAFIVGLLIVGGAWLSFITIIGWTMIASGDEDEIGSTIGIWWCKVTLILAGLLAIFIIGLVITGTKNI